MPNDSQNPRVRRFLLRAVSVGSGVALLGATGCSSSSTAPSGGGISVEAGQGDHDGGQVQGTVVDPGMGVQAERSDASGIMVEHDAGTSIDDAGDDAEQVLGLVANPGDSGPVGDSVEDAGTTTLDASK